MGGGLGIGQVGGKEWENGDRGVPGQSKSRNAIPSTLKRGGGGCVGGD